MPEKRVFEPVAPAAASTGYSRVVSVLFPVYKPNLGMLREAVSSILGQDYPDFELVIVEDPSDRTGREVIDSFNDTRIRYHINEKRTSFAEQMNLGLSMSRGDLVARMDADDIAEPGRISRQIEFMRENPDICVLGSAIRAMDEDCRLLGIRTYPVKPDEIARALRLYSAMAHPTVMYRRAEILAIGGYRPEFGISTEYDLWSRLVLSGRKLYNLNEPLLKYRIHTKATKIYALRDSLRYTLAIKDLHFRGRRGYWNFIDEMRYQAERFFLVLPPRLVFKTFMLVAIKKERG